jgi:Histidine kinase-, DNA gyrase B-, and HSP90-like ATPase
MSKELYYLNVPPSTGEIKAMIHATSMDLKTCVAELIANSIDQDPTEIALSLDRKKPAFTISDNGNGCPALEKMIRIGTHVPSKKDTIGRFGVGFKDAVIWLGDYVTIDSMTRKGKKQMAIADWQEMISLDSWNVGFRNDSAREMHGVTVEVTDLRGHRFRAWNQVSRYVAELFSAAIDAGITIAVDGKTVQSIPQPLLTDAVEFEGTFGGLGFKGVAGILVDKKSGVSGWEIRYSPQTICLGYAKAGFGTYSSQGFYGRFYMVDADKKWKLNRNKTASDDLEDVLNCEYMQSVIRPILEKIKARGESLAIQLNQLQVQTYLTNLLERAKVTITEEDEPCGQRGRTHRPGPGPSPNPGPNGLLTNTRKKRVHDPLSKTKEKIKQAQTLHIFPHMEPQNRGLGYVEVVDQGKAIKIYIDASTAAGKSIWATRIILLHHAIMYLGIYFGLQVDILGQLRLPIGDVSSRDEVKIAQSTLYLFEHVDLNEFESSIVAA